MVKPLEASTKSFLLDGDIGVSFSISHLVLGSRGPCPELRENAAVFDVCLWVHYITNVAFAESISLRPLRENRCDRRVKPSL